MYDTVQDDPHKITEQPIPEPVACSVSEPLCPQELPGVEPAVEAPRKKNRIVPQDASSSDKKRIGALIAIIVVMLVIAVFIVGFFDQLNTEAGRQALVEQIRGKGPLGVLILFGLQMVQVIVAVIPGEAVELIGGMIYGPVWGTLIIMAGVLVSSALIFLLVRKLGYPFVSKIVSEKDLNRFKWLSDSSRLGLVVFLLYLCPGLPKDILGYIVPLTEMRMSTFLVLSNVGRLPGVLVLALSGSSFLAGDYTVFIIVCAVGVALAILGFCFREKLISGLQKFRRTK